MRVAIDMFVAESIYNDNHEHPSLGSCTLLDELARLEQENEYFIITGRPQKYRMQITMPNIRIYSV
ncbi:MAG TPA: hypothetical protein VFB12_01195, partial [Ktedonobacteraceae bacterium]|nr:hypothetical protein [Ktedonobacteraceae bacterium]